MKTKCRQFVGEFVGDEHIERASLCTNLCFPGERGNSVEQQQ